jgi:hypothetical protein
MLKVLIIYFLTLFQQTPKTFTGIEYINGTDSLKVTLRISHELFIRDYQQTIFDDIDLTTLRNFKPFPSDLANNYLNSKLKIIVNNREIIGKLQRMVEDEKDIRFILLYRVNRNLKSFKIINTILTGLSSRVENLVIVNDRYSEKAFKLTSEHTEEIFILKN